MVKPAAPASDSDTAAEKPTPEPQDIEFTGFNDEEMQVAIEDECQPCEG